MNNKLKLALKRFPSSLELHIHIQLQLIITQVIRPPFTWMTLQREAELRINRKVDQTAITIPYYQVKASFETIPKNLKINLVKNCTFGRTNLIQKRCSTLYVKPILLVSSAEGDLEATNNLVAVEDCQEWSERQEKKKLHLQSEKIVKSNKTYNKFINCERRRIISSQFWVVFVTHIQTTGNTNPQLTKFSLSRKTTEAHFRTQMFSRPLVHTTISQLF